MRRKKKTIWQPVVLGFGAMYLVIMALATCLVKEKFVEEFQKEFEETAVLVMGQISEKEFSMEGKEWQEEERQSFYERLLKDFRWSTDQDTLRISIALYDRDKRLLAKTRECMGGREVWSADSLVMQRRNYWMDDFLSLEEKEVLAEYEWKNIQDSISQEKPEKYRFSVLMSPQDSELWGIFVQEITWTEKKEQGEEAYHDPLTGIVYSMEISVVNYETGEEEASGTVFRETDSKILWQWMNPDVGEEQRKTGNIENVPLVFPYMSYAGGSYDSWHQWAKSQYLHDFPHEADSDFAWGERAYSDRMADSNGLFYRGKYQQKVGMTDNPFSYMEIRMESCPWKDSVNYMKYVYLAGLALAAACAGKVVFAFHRVYDRQALLEETRRDMTNAMAHELKTPLGVIRNFAENMLEHNMEEKREYYLSQIIGQTEEMDRLVVEMIELSKLDSEELVLERETVSFSELIRVQMERLEPMIREKQIQVQYEIEEDFTVRGDKEYLSKAIGNLLGNGVDYKFLEAELWSGWTGRSARLRIPAFL